MPWIVAIAVAIAALAAAVAIQRGRAPTGSSLGAWGRGLALSLLLLLSMRSGLRLLPLVAPLALWLIAGILREPRTRRGPEQTSTDSRTAMSRDEALRVLGVNEGASPEQIMAAHRQLIKKVHPDQGGSSFLAQQVNEAKQVLLEG